ncbi:TPR repeat-containing protein [Chloroherpeton thalassium ATCC 35110]|uniref:TPR repeat-containing protein n=1 Tax=Chloroherpeton thalassium (strain ATCC 35110 / GB-78) TaxID=517418 RepID=B3QT81_CHLT3|nr:hypothetical protein [Chloroherpeton thalassium]ACF14180.1 TPR repeat-containing protein [Chloroherpeton thalassium ATCC 35110]
MPEYVHNQFNQSTLLNSVFYYGEKKIPKLLAFPQFPTDVFLGRKDDLAAVHTKLFSKSYHILHVCTFGLVSGFAKFFMRNNLLLLVNGEGGIGKTTLAAKYYYTYHNDYAHLAWVFAETSLIEALLTLALPLDISFGDTMTELERLDLLLGEMANLKKPCLLIVDNANRLEELEKYYGKLRSCPNFHILLTSRVRELSNAKTHFVGHLDKQIAKKLFTVHYPAHRREEDELLEALLKAVGYNTLVIELLAKSLKNGNRYRVKYPLSELLKDLTEKGLFGLRESHEVETLYHSSQGALRKEKPEAILAAMYSLAALPETQSALLSLFAVLPAEKILFETLADLLPNTDTLDSDLAALDKKGWIEFDEQGKSFKCSPVVQETVRTQNKADLFARCLPVIETLIEKFDYEEGIGHLPNISYQTGFLYARYAESLLGFTNTLNYSVAVLYERIGSFHQTTGNVRKALGFFDAVAKVFEELHEAYPEQVGFKNGLAISYAKLGQIHDTLGDATKALGFFEADAKLTKELHEAYPEQVAFKNGLAISYNYLGNSHLTLGNSSKALDFYEKYNRLMKGLHETYPEQVGFKNGLAISYSKLGEIHATLGDATKALGFFEAETKLFEELHEAYPEQVGFKNGLAISYEKLGETHATLGDATKALGFFEVYAKLTKELHEAYPEQGGLQKRGWPFSYSKLGRDTRHTGATPRRRSAFLKRMQKLTKELHEAYPEQVGFKNGLAISYAKLGQTHDTLGDATKALGFFEAYAKLTKELHEAYPEQVGFKNGLAISYEKLGETHATLGDALKALGFFEAETKLFEELHEAYPEQVAFKNGLAISYSKLGQIHDTLGDAAKALGFFEAETKLFEELHEAYPEQVGFKNGLAISYSKLGEIHDTLGDATKALGFFEADAKLTKELHEAYPEQVGFKNGLAISYANLGQMHARLEDALKGKTYFVQAETLWRELTEKHPEIAEYQKFLSMVRKELENLG